MLYFAIALIASLGASLILTPKVRDFLITMGLGDNPDGIRKIHVAKIPNLGGIAIFASTVFAFALVSAFDIAFYKYLSSNFLWFFLGISLIIIAGILDDVYNVTFKQKFIVQISAATLVVIMNELTVSVIKEPISGNLIFLDERVGLIFSVFWIVGICNAFNLIDGMDGLAAGVAVISCIVMGLISFISGDIYMAIIYLIFVGSLLGFLRYNFSPASIFMGDTGSLFIGFTLGYLTLKFRPVFDSSFSMLIPVLALIFPIIDTILAPVRRIISGQHPFSPDRGHIHHRLMDRYCFSQRKTVLYIYSLCIAIGGLAVFSAFSRSDSVYVYVLVAHFVILVLLSKLGYFSDIRKSFLFLWVTSKRKLNSKSFTRLPAQTQIFFKKKG